MQRAIKIALLAAGLSTVPSASAILGANSPSMVRQRGPIGISFFAERGVPAGIVEDGGDKPDSLIELAQAMGAPWGLSNPGFPGRFAGPPGPPGPHPVPHAPGPFGFAPPAGPPPSPQAACEEDVDRLTGLAGYLKSKMQLQGDQQAAWQKVEQAAAPGAEKIRNLCARLPSRSMPPPGLLEYVDLAEMQMTARLELLRAVHGPLMALHETLSSDQRALLAGATQLFRPVPPPPPGPRP